MAGSTQSKDLVTILKVWEQELSSFSYKVEGVRRHSLCQRVGQWVNVWPFLALRTYLAGLLVFETEETSGTFIKYIYFCELNLCPRLCHFSQTSSRTKMTIRQAPTQIIITLFCRPLSKLVFSPRRFFDNFVIVRSGERNTQPLQGKRVSQLRTARG